MSETETATAEPFRIASLGRHSLIYGIGVILNKAVAIVMLPIYTRWLTPDDYGVLQLITMTFEVVTILAGSRIAVGVFHFFHKQESETGRRDVISTMFLLLACMYVAAAAGTIYFAPSIAQVVFEDVGSYGIYATYVRLAAISMTFEGLFLVPMALIQLRNRSKLFVLVSLARLLLQVVLNLIFLIPLYMGVLGVLWSAVITTAVIGTVLSVNLLHQVGFRFQSSMAQAALRFGIPLVVMQVATFIVTFGDRYFLNKAADTAEVGIYGLAYQFGFLVMTLGFVPFNQVWDPQRFAVAKRPDRDTIYARVFVYVSILVVSAALGIALFAGDVLALIADPSFHRATIFVPVLAAAYVFQAWSYFLNLGIYITERTEYFTLANWISAIVALAGYIWLIPEWQAWGATLTTLAALAVRCWLTHVFSQRLWHVAYEWGPVTRLTLMAAGVGAISVLSPAMPLLHSLALHTALFVGFCALVWYVVLKGEERTMVRQLVSQQLAMVRSGS